MVQVRRLVVEMSLGRDQASLQMMLTGLYSTGRRWRFWCIYMLCAMDVLFHD